MHRRVPTQRGHRAEPDRQGDADQPGGPGRSARSQAPQYPSGMVQSASHSPVTSRRAGPSGKLNGAIITHPCEGLSLISIARCSPAYESSPKRCRRAGRHRDSPVPPVVTGNPRRGSRRRAQLVSRGARGNHEDGAAPLLRHRQLGDAPAFIM